MRITIKQLDKWGVGGRGIGVGGDNELAEQPVGVVVLSNKGG